MARLDHKVALAAAFAREGCGSSSPTSTTPSGTPVRCISAPPGCALQDACETNPSLLSTRLKELSSAGRADHDSAGYFLTPRGRELFDLMLPLSIRAEQWGRAREPG
jgi:hypothetical protein